MSRLGRPPSGRAVPAAQRMRRMRERRKLAGLHAVTRWVAAGPDKSAAVVSSDHFLHDARSLAMHALIAVKINRNTELLAVAHRNLKRWRSRFGSQPDRWWLDWHQLLRRPRTELIGALLDPGESATRLRQSSPFAGVLTTLERRKIYEAFRT